MRPALLRLLKRPSAVYFLGDLVSSPLGIEQLDVSRRCIQCQIRREHRRAAFREDIALSDSGVDSTVQQTRPDHEVASKLHVYDITPTGKQNSISFISNQPYLSQQEQNHEEHWVLDPDRLEYESDVGHLNDIGTRLVDDPSRRNDFALWEELLRYRQRHYGEKGTLDIWEGLTQRVDGVDLPVEGEQADFFWQSFVEVGLTREQVLDDLTDYAWELWRRTGRRWPRFHEAVVGGYLDRGLPMQAVRWHRRLQKPHLSHPNDIVRVFDQALSCEPRHCAGSFLACGNERVDSSRPGLQAFKDMCRATEGHRIYNVVIPALINRGRHVDALLMHEFLVKRQDLPPSFEDMRPLLEYAQHAQLPSSKKFKEDIKRIRKNLIDLRRKLAPPDSQDTDSRDQPQPESGETATEEEKGESGWMQEKPFKDEFGARLFATKALTLDMIISGLQMFGVPAIGPLSLREMALRANGSKDILEKIATLRKGGIAIRDSAFSRLVERLAAENRDIMLQDLLHSDQHPDVLEDADLQESLLVSYYMARDWRQYNLTLTILGDISEDGPDLLNVHFRKHIAAEEWRAALATVDEIHRNGKMLSNRSIDFMIEHVLTPRVPGKAPHPKRRHQPVNEEAFLIRVLQQVAEFGGKVKPELWLEALKRLGMATFCRWDEIRNLCLWLAKHYAGSENPLIARSNPGKAMEGADLAEHRSMLRRVFNPQMQMALVAWGFKLRPATKKQKRYEIPGAEGQDLVPWVRGLVLLRELQQRGVSISPALVRRACRQRLAVLFGRPRYSNRRWNRLLRRENPYDASRVVGDLIKVWGPSLFGGQEKDDLQGLVNPPSPSRSLRRSRANQLWAAQF
ncbi:hypothetical protein VTN77DRAFT_3389 [Rasamsonia byssochlamydoides]|uniref:uncharacterized protein n=1 Tax=Rasamsonia byssochlamydoides TaxID=89139 RepID=UPI0037428418